MNLETVKTALTNRRGFIGRLAGSSAVLAGGVFGFETAVEAHEERLTMLPAMGGRDLGLASYQVRRSGGSSDVERIVAQLVDMQGATIGEFARTRHRRGEIDGESRKTKWYKDSEVAVLRVGAETLRVETDNQRSEIGLRYNGRHLGVVKTSSRDTSNFAMGEFIQTHDRLCRLVGVVSLDLERAFAPGPGEISACCCQLGCDHPPTTHTCDGADFYRSQCCYDAETCTGNKCSNSLCWGCCALSCDAYCAFGDFVCTCRAFGGSCVCNTWPDPVCGCPPGCA